MQYLSPAAVLGESLSGTLDKKAIQLGRKKLFADLELSGGSTIELQGRSFTKNDIVQYLESLLKEDALSYHSAVNEDQVLLGFLENIHIGRKERFRHNPLYEQEQFIQWISPYFYSSFTAFMSECFLHPDEDKLIALLNNKLLMTARDLESSWDSVTRILFNDLSTLEQFVDQSRSERSHEALSVHAVSSLMEYSYVRMIILLPKSRFDNLRDEFALQMQNACIIIFNRNIRYRSSVRTWMDNAILLASSQEVKNTLGEKLAEMENIVSADTTGSGSSGSDSGSASGIFKFLAFALFIIIKIATCNSGNSTPAYEWHPSPEQSRMFDSILKSHRDTEKLESVPLMDTSSAKYRTRHFK
ncbi:hypothetical protein [Paraflavitalea pollutisoli]|uniref:hypothetical protein n=1 Tax=Paraflavitalea pollutisoli TaxID=3034143 RepID=UPI0023ECE2FF|nr:hypothetical protein [Paraflavitalea sp. H1-2-19X]